MSREKKFKRIILFRFKEKSMENRYLSSLLPRVKLTKICVDPMQYTYINHLNRYLLLWNINYDHGWKLSMIYSFLYRKYPRKLSLWVIIKLLLETNASFCYWLWKQTIVQKFSTMKTKRGESRLHGKKSVIGLEIQWLYFCCFKYSWYS